MDNISLGRVLSGLREQMGLTQDDIASRIHVRKSVVVDIENDQLTHTPLVFHKGYIRSYAELVGLSSDEYQPYMDALSQKIPSYKIQNYTQKDKQRKRSKMLVFISLFIIISALGIALYWVNKENKNNFVEVSHYISPSSSDRINS